MKKKLAIVGLLGFTFLFGCSHLENSATAEKELPYSIYEYTDVDGCEYVIVYSHNYGYVEESVGVGITQKVNQPLGCAK